MILRLVVLVLGVVVLLSGVTLADEARQLRLEAGALIQAAEAAETARERRALLEEAHGKLLEIRERYPSASVRVTLYLGGRRVSLSPEDVAAMAVASGLDIGNLREVIGRMPSPTAVDENGWTDLHYAAALNLPELIEALLDGGAEVAAPLKADGEPVSDRLQQSLRDLEIFSDRVLSSFRRDGDMPLHVAAMNNAREASALLVARGADIHAKNKNGTTPLHYAAYGNALDAALDLIARGADIHAKNKNGATPLHYAAYGNALDVAADLIARGADIHAKNKNGTTPLHAAANGNALDVAADLIARGADIHARDNYGSTPLHYAAHRNALDVAADLIARGADIHAENNDGKTPLQIAEERGHREALEAAVLKRRQQAAARLAGLDVGNLRDVLGRELSPTEVDENGWTDLHWAAALNLPELIEVLLDEGADVAAPLKADGVLVSDRLKQSLRSLDLFPKFPRHGYVPLHVAAMHNAREAVVLLIVRGADIHAKGNDGVTPLHYAAARNALDVAADLIAGGADIHVKDNSGSTPLHYAAYGNALDVAADLIARGADIHAKNNDGKTPLQIAEERGHREALEAAVLKRRQQVAARLAGLDVGNLRGVLGRELSPTEVDENGWTDLHWAAVLNLPDLAEALLVAGAEVDPKLKGGSNGSPPSDRLIEKFHLAGVDAGGGYGFYGETPLHIAAQKNALETAEVLVAGGADIHEGHWPDGNGWTPLQYAIARGALTVAKMLVGLEGAIRGPDDLNSLLYFAAQMGATEVAAMLIERGADIHAKVNGGTPLHTAARSNHSGTAVMLIERGADVNAKNKDGNTPLHRAVWGTHAPSTSSAVVLIERGADIHAKNKSGETPLHVVAKEYDSIIAAMLIERGADVHARNASGETPLQIRKSLRGKFEAFSRGGASALWEQEDSNRLLYYGAGSDNTEIATMLIEFAIERGADVNANISPFGFTALHKAVPRSGAEVVSILIERGADIHAKNKSGETPLHMVAKDWKYAESEKIAAMLIARGADIHAKDESGKTPLQLWNKLEEIATTTRAKGK